MKQLTPLYSKARFLEIANGSEMPKYVLNNQLSCPHSRTPKDCASKKNYVIFSFTKKEETSYRIIELFEKGKEPVDGMSNQHQGMFIALCFMVGLELPQITYHGICNIEITYEEKGGGRSNNVVVSNAGFESPYMPDLLQIAMALKQYKKDNRLEHIRIDDNIFIEISFTDLTYTVDRLCKALSIVDVNI